MKRILFFLLSVVAFSATTQAQNYLFEITPANGEFRVLITDDTRESYPRDITDFGLVDTANLQLLAYQRIEQARSREASLRIQALIADLNAEQTATSVGGVVVLNYQAWINARLAGVYDGNYQYQVRGTATNLEVVISGGDLLRASDNVVLATLSGMSSNWIQVTVVGSGEVIDLYQFGNTWVGKNAAGQFVTLKRI